MKKDLIDTVMEKEFHALTDAERKELASFCSTEDEYNQMKDVFIGVESLTYEQPAPKAETKQRLDELFDATYPKAAPIWYNSVLAVVVPKDKAIHRQPLVQIAAIALIAFLLVPFWNTEVDVVNERVQSAAVTKPSTEQPRSNEVENESPVVPASDVEPSESENLTRQPVETPVLIASASDPVSAEVGSGATMTSPSSAPGSSHPDGVFIAVSQPASDNPEMFDLLTATF